MTKNDTINEYFKAIKELSDDKNILETKKFTWFSNGEKGFRHSHKQCSELKISSKLVQHELSLQEASSKRICVKCLEYNLSKLSESSGNAFVFFLKNYKILRNLLKSADDDTLKTCDYTYLFSTYEQVEDVKEAVRNILEIDDFVNNNVNAIEKFNTMYSLYSKTLQEQLVSRRSEFMLDIALVMLRDTGNRRSASANIPSELMSILEPSDNPIHSGSNISILYNSWTSLKLERSETNKAENYLTNVYKTFHLKSLNQLKHVEISAEQFLVKQAENASSDNSILTLASEAWEKARDEASEQVINLWEKELHDILSDNSPTTVAVSSSNIHFSYPYGELWRKLKVTHTQYALGTDKVLLVMPKFAANFLENPTGNATAHYGGMRARNSANYIQVHNDVLPESLRETALTLWEPSELESVYANFELCVSTAKALA